MTNIFKDSRRDLRERAFQTLLPLNLVGSSGTSTFRLHL